MRDLVVLLCALAAIITGSAAQNCQAPALTLSKAANYFQGPLEYELGELTAEQIGSSMRVIEDERVTAPLQRIGDRVAKQFTDTDLKFRFFVVDAPEANAFALPGGRVYVTRKLISITKSEDELAGVLGHEMGHQVTHQSAIEWSRRFFDLLEVSEIKDRSDLRVRYHQYLERFMTRRSLLEREASRAGEEHQIVADQVAVYASARAGYDPAAVIAFWDRMTVLKGKKGNRFSDLFGWTRPESKRLREFVKTAALMPRSCVDTTSVRPSQAEFEAWRLYVTNYSGYGRAESLPGTVQKRKIEPPLRGDLTHLRFSHNGRYILAQDEGGIFVLSREPLKTLFRIEAEKAESAQWSPDDSQIVFHTKGLRVERWSLADQTRIDVSEVHAFGGCAQSALSPDGKYLLCLARHPRDFLPLKLEMYDVASNEVVFAKNEFIGAAARGWWVYLTYVLMQNFDGDLVDMEFSPDGKYAIVGGLGSQIIVDLASKQEKPMRRHLSSITTDAFAWLDSDRVVGADGKSGKVVRVSTDEVLVSDLPVGTSSIYGPGHGDYVIIAPLRTAPVGIIDLKEKKITMGSKTRAIDIYDGVFVNERVSGEIGLYTVAGKPPVATASLPTAPLPPLNAANLSADGSLLGLSASSRGAVWNLDTNKRVLYARGFDGLHFDGSGISMNFPPADRFKSRPMSGQSPKDFRKQENEKPGNSIAYFDLTDGQISERKSYIRKFKVLQAGSFAIVISSRDEASPMGGPDMTLEAIDVKTQQTLWSRIYSESRIPRMLVNPRSEYVLFLWPLDGAGAKEEFKKFPDARTKIAQLTSKDGWYLLEAVNLRNGEVENIFPIDTGKGSYSVLGGSVHGDSVVLLDNWNRTLVFSRTGQLRSRAFGTPMSVSPDGSVVVVQREPGRLYAIDSATGEPKANFTFPSRAAYSGFSKAGKKLTIVSEDQWVYTLEMESKAASAN